MIPDANIEWKEKAESVPLLQAAQMFGAKLKRAGAEWVGPCCYCGGTDRLGINPGKKKWVCRGAGGGSSVVSLAMHLGNLSFKQAVEQLTGEPCPTGGPAQPLSPAELAERDKRRQANEAAQRAREAQEEAREQNTLEAAQRIWDASKPIDGTLAQTYLFNRGIPVFESECLRFHPALPYPGMTGKFPAMICRVGDMGGELCAVWRIYLSDDGRKAAVDNAKLGLGPAGGGAVRIGGIGPKVAIAEGLESALGFWFLTGRKYPVLAALSTSGMVGIELPLCVESVTIALDGDRPIRKQGEEFVPAVPAGRKAAHALRDRLVSEGLSVTLAAEPPAGQDYLNIWQAMAGEMA